MVPSEGEERGVLPHCRPPHRSPGLVCQPLAGNQCVCRCFPRQRAVRALSPAHPQSPLGARWPKANPEARVLNPQAKENGLEKCPGITGVVFWINTVDLLGLSPNPPYQIFG
jgi:hypothetical protein